MDYRYDTLDDTQPDGIAVGDQAEPTEDPDAEAAEAYRRELHGLVEVGGVYNGRGNSNSVGEALRDSLTGLRFGLLMALSAARQAADSGIKGLRRWARLQTAGWPRP